MSDADEQPAGRKQPFRAPDRLAELGHPPPSRKHADGPPKLTARHRLLVEYMVSGCEHSFVSRIKRAETHVEPDGTKVTIERPLRPGEPMTLIEAADCLHIRRRNARQLSRTPIFQTELAKATQEFRDGQKLRSLQTMADIRDEPGDGKAADRKVRLQAATALLGEDAGRKGNAGVTVNVAVTPGYVIGRNGREPQPAPPIIEATLVEES